jgi:hypothetical protein
MGKADDTFKQLNAARDQTRDMQEKLDATNQEIKDGKSDIE